MEAMFKITFFTPIENAPEIKNAMFLAGAGKIGNYDQCSFETRGIGQFRPLAGAHPALGIEGRLEFVEELKIEMVCADEFIKEAVIALKKSHPYETPAFDVIKLVDLTF